MHPTFRRATGNPSRLTHYPSTAFTSRFAHLPHLSAAGLWLWLIFALGLALRLYHLDYYGLWYDEVASIEIARRGVAAIFTDRFGGMLVQTPLHYFIVWLMDRLADPASTASFVRLPSALAGALVPPCVYVLGRETLGRGPGLIAALLVALTPVQIMHSQDVRPYTMLTLFSVLTAYCLLRAERTGRAGWWAAFALAAMADLYISYFTITLFLPALAPYVLWVLYSLYGHGPGTGTAPAGRSRRYAPAAFAAIAIACIPLLLDLLRLERTAPNLGALPALVGTYMVAYFTRLAPVGVGGAVEEYAQWGLLLLAVVGLVSGVRSGSRRARGAVLCLSVVVIPALILAAFRTSNIVFLRYALFAVPFYYLLAAGGLVSVARQGQAATGRWLRPLAGVVAVAVGAGLVMLLAVGAGIYFNPGEHTRLSYMPDYRGAALYLARKATPHDLIIMVDEPALGMAVVNFYWHGTPPAPTYDSRDPRLFAQPTGDVGSVYWVISFFQNDPDFMEEISADPKWAGSQRFERVVVVEEHTDDLPASFDRLVSRLEARLPDFQPVKTLRGCVYQAQGQAEQAASAYRAAGAYYPQLGEEFLATAQGFAGRGDAARAWREAITSKFMQPGNPEVHRWLAAYLQQAGYVRESLMEARIAELLARSGSGTANSP